MKIKSTIPPNPDKGNKKLRELVYSMFVHYPNKSKENLDNYAKIQQSLYQN